MAAVEEAMVRHGATGPGPGGHDEPEVVPPAGIPGSSTGADVATDLVADAELAADVAGRASTVLMELRAGGGLDLGARGDLLAHELIVQELSRARPGDAVRSEEAPADEGADGGGGRLWVVDPLDGTREFAEGLPEFAVHVALVVGEQAVAGAVALPALGTVLSSGAPPVPGPRPSGAPLRVAVSRSRPPAAARKLVEALGAVLVSLGSAGYKVAAVLRGEVDAYVHAGGQYEWDSAAPVAVALAAGLHATRLDGSPLRYAQPDPYLPDLLVCRPELAEDILAVVGL